MSLIGSRQPDELGVLIVADLSAPTIGEGFNVEGQASTATAAEVAAIARSYFEAVDRRELDAAADLWHEDGSDDFVAVGVYHGPAAVAEFFRGVFAAVPDARITILRVTANDQGAAVQWTLDGTFTGEPFLGIVATGRRIALRGADCLEIEQGRIRHNTVYYDGASFARDVGLLPPIGSRLERAMYGAFNALTRGQRLLASRA
jgi:steroid delta-isomerase-like uncharacterized protein